MSRWLDESMKCFSAKRTFIPASRFMMDSIRSPNKLEKKVSTCTANSKRYYPKSFSRGASHVLILHLQKEFRQAIVS
jgi:hypothetical protein